MSGKFFVESGSLRVNLKIFPDKSRNLRYPPPKTQRKCWKCCPWIILRFQILHDKDTQSFPLYDLSQFFGWANGTESVDDDDVTPGTHWGYIDYKDAVAMMGDDEAEKIDWARLDLLPEDAGVDNTDSTVWIGTVFDAKLRQNEPS